MSFRREIILALSDHKDNMFEIKEEKRTDALSMVSWTYDQGKAYDAGKYKIDRSCDRIGGCPDPFKQQESGY